MYSFTSRKTNNTISFKRAVSNTQKKAGSVAKPKTTLEILEKNKKEIDELNKEYINNIKNKIDNDRYVQDTFNSKLNTILVPEEVSLRELLDNHLLTAVEYGIMPKDEAKKLVKKLLPQRSEKLVEEIISSYKQN